MDGFTTVEGQHTLDDGSKLYTKTWKPTGSVKAYMAFVHGFSDHCNNYNDLFPRLAAQGVEVRAFDQRLANILILAQAQRASKADLQS